MFSLELALWDVYMDNATIEEIRSEWNFEQALWDNHATGRHHTGFLLVLEVASSLICEVLDSNSGSVIHLIQLLATTAMKHTYMHHSTVSRRSPLFCSDELSSRQHHMSLKI